MAVGSKRQNRCRCDQRRHRHPTPTRCPQYSRTQRSRVNRYCPHDFEHRNPPTRRSSTPPLIGDRGIRHLPKPPHQPQQRDQCRQRSRRGDHRSWLRPNKRQFRSHGNVNSVNGVAGVSAGGLNNAQPGIEPICDESVADLRREPTLSNGVVLTPAQLEFLSCDREVTRIIFGPKSEILDVGRAKRTVTSQLRKAVLARDRGCQFPGCGAAPYTLEIHHIQHWANGGVTSARNSIALCRFHHQHAHQREITIRPSQHTGRWQFHDQNGQLLNTRDPLTRLTTENTETNSDRQTEREGPESGNPESGEPEPPDRKSTRLNSSELNAPELGQAEPRPPESEQSEPDIPGSG